GPIPWQRRI
uniref:Tryptophyllin-2 n=1 Tax=Ascaphus truei TaxID=8439 RepID=TY2_ASCTR|nr:RecName: Full=Tryptophyllin-2 [Ascaphus truei]